MLGRLEQTKPRRIPLQYGQKFNRAQGFQKLADGRTIIGTDQHGNPITPDLGEWESYDVHDVRTVSEGGLDYIEITGTGKINAGTALMKVWNIKAMITGYVGLSASTREAEGAIPKVEAWMPPPKTGTHGIGQILHGFYWNDPEKFIRDLKEIGGVDVVAEGLVEQVNAYDLEIARMKNPTVQPGRRRVIWNHRTAPAMWKLAEKIRHDTEYRVTFTPEGLSMEDWSMLKKGLDEARMKGESVEYKLLGRDWSAKPPRGVDKAEWENRRLAAEITITTNVYQPALRIGMEYAGKTGRMTYETISSLLEDRTGQGEAFKEAVREGVLPRLLERSAKSREYHQWWLKAHLVTSGRASPTNPIKIEDLAAELKATPGGSFPDRLKQVAAGRMIDLGNGTFLPPSDVLADASSKDTFSRMVGVGGGPEDEEDRKDADALWGELNSILRLLENTIRDTAAVPKLSEAATKITKSRSIVKGLLSMVDVGTEGPYTSFYGIRPAQVLVGQSALMQLFGDTNIDRINAALRASRAIGFAQRSPGTDPTTTSTIPVEIISVDYARDALLLKHIPEGWNGSMAFSQLMMDAMQGDFDGDRAAVFIASMYAKGRLMTERGLADAATNSVFLDRLYAGLELKTGAKISSSVRGINDYVDRVVRLKNDFGSDISEVANWIVKTVTKLPNEATMTGTLMQATTGVPASMIQKEYLQTGLGKGMMAFGFNLVVRNLELVMEQLGLRKSDLEAVDTIFRTRYSTQQGTVDSTGSAGLRDVVGLVSFYSLTYSSEGELGGYVQSKFEAKMAPPGREFVAMEDLPIKLIDSLLNYEELRGLASKNPTEQGNVAVMNQRYAEDIGILLAKNATERRAITDIVRRGGKASEILAVFGDPSRFWSEGGSVQAMLGASIMRKHHMKIARLKTEMAKIADKASTKTYERMIGGEEQMMSSLIAQTGGAKAGFGLYNEIWRAIYAQREAAKGDLRTFGDIAELFDALQEYGSETLSLMRKAKYFGVESIIDPGGMTEEDFSNLRRWAKPSGRILRRMGEGLLGIFSKNKFGFSALQDMGKPGSFKSIMRSLESVMSEADEGEGPETPSSEARLPGAAELWGKGFHRMAANVFRQMMLKDPAIDPTAIFGAEADKFITYFRNLESYANPFEHMKNDKGERLAWISEGERGLLKFLQERMSPDDALQSLRGVSSYSNPFEDAFMAMQMGSEPSWMKDIRKKGYSSAQIRKGIEALAGHEDMGKYLKMGRNPAKRTVLMELLRGALQPPMAANLSRAPMGTPNEALGAGVYSGPAPGAGFSGAQPPPPGGMGDIPSAGEEDPPEAPDFDFGALNDALRSGGVDEKARNNIMRSIFAMWGGNVIFPEAPNVKSWRALRGDIQEMVSGMASGKETLWSGMPSIQQALSAKGEGGGPRYLPTEIDFIRRMKESLFTGNATPITSAARIVERLGGEGSKQLSGALTQLAGMIKGQPMPESMLKQMYEPGGVTKEWLGREYASGGIDPSSAFRGAKVFGISMGSRIESIEDEISRQGLTGDDASAFRAKALSINPQTGEEMPGAPPVKSAFSGLYQMASDAGGKLGISGYGDILSSAASGRLNPTQLAMLGRTTGMSGLSQSAAGLKELISEGMPTEEYIGKEYKQASRKRDDELEKSAETLKQFNSVLKRTQGHMEDYGKSIDNLVKGTTMTSAAGAKAGIAKRDIEALYRMSQADESGQFSEAIRQAGVGGLVGRAATMEEEATEAKLSRLEEGGISGFGRRLAGGVGDVFSKATSGMGLLYMSRMWGMTGGEAQKYIDVAAGQDYGSWQAATAIRGSGVGGISGVAGSILETRARAEIAQGQAGRQAYMAYGPAIEALSTPVAASAIGMFGPAAGIGAASGYLLGSTALGPVGWAAGAAIGAGVAGYGMYNYGQAIQKGGADVALQAYRNPNDQMAMLSMAFAPAEQARESSAILKGAPPWITALYMAGVTGANMPSAKARYAELTAQGTTMMQTPLSKISSENLPVALSGITSGLTTGVWKGMLEEQKNKSLSGVAAYDELLNNGVSPEQIIGMGGTPLMRIAATTGRTPQETEQLAAAYGMGTSGAANLTMRTGAMSAYDYRKWNMAMGANAPLFTMGMTSEMAGAMPSISGVESGYLSQAMQGGGLQAHALKGYLASDEYRSKVSDQLAELGDTGRGGYNKAQKDLLDGIKVLTKSVDRMASVYEAETGQIVGTTQFGRAGLAAQAARPGMFEAAEAYTGIRLTAAQREKFAGGQIDVVSLQAQQRAYGYQMQQLQGEQQLTSMASNFYQTSGRTLQQAASTGALGGLTQIQTGTDDQGNPIYAEIPDVSRRFSGVSSQWDIQNRQGVEDRRYQGVQLGMAAGTMSGAGVSTATTTGRFLNPITKQWEDVSANYGVATAGSRLAAFSGVGMPNINFGASRLTQVPQPQYDDKGDLIIKPRPLDSATIKEGERLRISVQSAVIDTQKLSVGQLGQMGLQDRQFMEGWLLQGSQQARRFEWGREDIERNRERGLIQLGWQEQDLRTGFGRQQTQFGWQQEDLAYQGSRTALSFGWQMEDIQENMRYATGRDRRRLAKQAERTTIGFAMDMGRLDTEDDRLQQRRQWAQEDFDKELERIEVRRQWLEDDYEREKSRLEEQMGWNEELHQLSLKHHQENMENAWLMHQANVDHYNAIQLLQAESTKSERVFWAEMSLNSLNYLNLQQGIATKQKDINDLLTTTQAMQKTITDDLNSTMSGMNTFMATLKQKWDDLNSSSSASSLYGGGGTSGGGSYR
jgi:hypothetical protein